VATGTGILLDIYTRIRISQYEEVTYFVSCVKAGRAYFKY
jgi:hypothetical protein